MIVLNSPARGFSMRAALAAVVVLTMLSAACSNGSRHGPNGGSAAAEPAPVEKRRAVVEKEGKERSPQRAPDTEPEPTQGSGEVPPQLLAIFVDDLARRALVKPETITVVSATEQQWSDGSLGCAQPGMGYIQIVIPGYRVVLKAGGDRYAYHSDQRGHFVVCSNGVGFPPVKEQARKPAPAE